MEVKIRLWLVMALMSISAYSSTDCCMCMHRHPQEIFCNSGFVIYAKLLRSTTNNMITEYGVNYRLIQYEIETLKVIKGDSEIQHLKFMYTETRHGCAYSFSRDDYNKDHLITGVMENGRVDLGSCNYIVALSQLSEAQKKGIEDAYWCDCKICYTSGCRGRNSCKYDGYHPLKIYLNLDDQMCAPNENGECTWQPVETWLSTSSTS
ncbi:metalloproteinase inhibitor 3-like [Lissotriton helveticus]